MRPFRKIKTYIALVIVGQLGEVSLRADSCEFKPKLCVQMSEVEKELRPIKDHLADLHKKLAEIEMQRKPASVSKKKAWKEKLAEAKRKVDLKTSEVDRRLKTVMLTAELTDQKHEVRIKTLKLAQDEILEARAELDNFVPSSVSKN